MKMVMTVSSLRRSIARWSRCGATRRGPKRQAELTQRERRTRLTATTSALQPRVESGGACSVDRQAPRLVMAASKARRGQLRGQRVRALFKMKHAMMKRRSRGLRLRALFKIKHAKNRAEPRTEYDVDSLDLLPLHLRQALAEESDLILRQEKLQREVDELKADREAAENSLVAVVQSALSVTPTPPPQTVTPDIEQQIA